VVAFIMTLIIGFAGVGAVLRYSKRRPVGAPLSWGEAMAAATFAFFLFFWWYGVIPHQFLTWADNELGWTVDNYLIESTGNVPVTISFLVIRDFLVLGIYGLGVALHVGLWAIWQDRAKAKPKTVPASRYGRPLVREG
jgi:amino acid transporter